MDHSGSLPDRDALGNGHELLVAHSSDLHMDDREESQEVVVQVIRTAEAAGARVLLLAGDIFDHNRVSLRTLDSVTRTLGDARLDVVILPGNHDCLGLDSVYERGGLASPKNIHVLGVTSDDLLDLETLDLSIWGRAHADYRDMTPLGEPLPRVRSHHIAVALAIGSPSPMISIAHG